MLLFTEEFRNTKNTIFLLPTILIIDSLTMNKSSEVEKVDILEDLALSEGTCDSRLKQQNSTVGRFVKLLSMHK